MQPPQTIFWRDDPAKARRPQDGTVPSVRKNLHKLKHFYTTAGRDKGAGTFHSAGQSKEG